MTFGIAAVQARISQIDPNFARTQTTQFGPNAGSTSIPLDRSASVADFEGALATALGATPTLADPVATTTSVSTTSTTPASLARYQTGSLDVPYGALFEQAGAAHGVDPALLAAVASAESDFTPTAVSHAGAEGLMQLMPGTAAGLGVTDSFDPEQAVDGAARLLAGHLQTFGSIELALAAYNAGGGAVSRFGGIPPYAETQAYVPKVMATYEELRR